MNFQKSFIAVSTFVAVLLRSHSSSNPPREIFHGCLGFCICTLSSFKTPFSMQFLFFLHVSLKKSSMTISHNKKNCSQFPTFIPKRIKSSSLLSDAYRVGRSPEAAGLNHSCRRGNLLNRKREGNKETASCKIH